MERAVYFFFRAFNAVLRSLPLKLCFGLGLGLGRVAHTLLWPYRKLALSNVRVAFGSELPERETRRIVKRHFSLLGANLLAGARLASMPRDQVLQAVEVVGAERLAPLHAAGRGIVGLVLHQSCWEALAHCFHVTWPGQGGAVYQPLGNRFIDAYVNALRQKQGMLLFERRRGLLSAARLLDSAGVVGVLCDQHAGDKGIWAPFFGRLASTTPLPDLLARRTGSPLVPYFLTTSGFARWRLTILPYFEADPDPAASAARINQVVESQVREAPEDWFWVHDRWKISQSHFLLSSAKRSVHCPNGRKLAPFRMVLRSPNWLGDACMSLPAVRAFSRGRPDAQVSIVCRPNLAPFWRRCADVHEVVVLSKRRSAFAAAVAIRRAGPFDAGVLFPNSIRSALEFRLAGVSYLVGERGGWLRRRLLTKAMPKPGRKAVPQHQAQIYLRLAERCGAANARLEAEQGEPFLRAEQAGPSGRYGVLCPGAVYGPAKRWLPERFAETARLAAERHGLRWIVTGTTNERDLCEEVASAAGDCAQNFAGETSLDGLIDLLAGAAVVLSNDTGTMHLAAVTGVPVVAIFGSTEPVLTGPLGGRHEIVRRQVECSPCFLRNCPLDFRCMNAVTTRHVATALDTILARKIDTTS